MSEETSIKTIKDVLFYYTSTTYAQEQYKAKGEVKVPMSDHPKEGHSYEIKILITEERFKGFKKAFKGAKNLPNVKEYSKEECVTRLGMEEEPEDDMILIKFSQSAMMGKKGDRKESRPLKQIGIINGKRDRNGLDILPETNIGNGSKGHLQFKPVETKFGLYLYPHALCITELVPWITSGGNDGSVDEEGFGIETVEEEESAEESFDDDQAPF